MPDARQYRRTTFRVQGMDCPDEIALLRRALSGAEGLVDVSFSLIDGTMTVVHDEAALTARDIIARVRSTGLSATPAGEARTADLTLPRGPIWMTAISALATAGGAALSLVPAPAIGHTPWPAVGAYVLAIIAAWRYVAPRAWAALRRGRLDMNVLMTIAVIGAAGLGEWFEAATVACLFMLANLLESWSVTRARRAVRALMDLAPPTARILEPDGQQRECPVEEVSVGQRILVRPGEKFPLDGRVIEGHTAVDQAPITGESVPVDKQPGDEVFAGTINHDGAVTVEVTRPASQTVLAGVVRLVEQARQQRSPSEQFVERFARWYTPAVVVGAAILCVAPPLLAAADWSEWFYRALVLLVIACPCALVISTPVSIVSGLTAAARRGVLIKGGEFLEAVAHIPVFAIDKTGTLTVGRPEVDRIIPLNNTPREHLLALAAALEQRSEHPIAAAIVRSAQRLGAQPPPCEHYQAIRGKGATGTVSDRQLLIGNHRLLEEHGLCREELHSVMVEHEDCHHTAVALATPERPLGVILLADALRPEAPAVMAELRRLGVRRIVMLTGDNAGTARAVARQCGDIEYRAELLPADKVAVVEDLRRRHGSVAMVGDGINDAPALAAATVGIAMGAAGTDAALESAHLALMTDDLRRLPWLIRHSRRTRRIIAENVTVSLAVKALFLALAIPGLANLWMAITADMGASLLVIANALRLLGSGRPSAHG